MALLSGACAACRALLASSRNCALPSRTVFASSRLVLAVSRVLVALVRLDWALVCAACAPVRVACASVKPVCALPTAAASLPVDKVAASSWNSACCSIAAPSSVAERPSMAAADCRSAASPNAVVAFKSSLALLKRLSSCCRSAWLIEEGSKFTSASGAKDSTEPKACRALSRRISSPILAIIQSTKVISLDSMA